MARCAVRAGLRRNADSPPSIKKLRTFAVGEINERPVFRTLDQFLAHGILQNVIRFIPAALFASQAMLEKIALPADAHGFGRPFLPFADNELERLAGRRERNQRMNVIRHEQKNMRPPEILILTMPDGFKENRCDCVRGELVGHARFAIDGDEINLFLRINPQRDFVRQ